MARAKNIYTWKADDAKEVGNVAIQMSETVRQRMTPHPQAPKPYTYIYIEEGMQTDVYRVSRILKKFCVSLGGIQVTEVVSKVVQKEELQLKQLIRPAWACQARQQAASY